MEARDQRANMLGEEKISKVLIKLSVPAIIAMLVNAIYNIVDTMFVGRLGETSAIGAVSVVFPLFMLIGAVGQTFGVGAGSYISRLLGEKKKKEADKTAATAFFSSLACGIIFTIFGLIFIEPLLKAFGATSTILPYAKGYASILVAGSIFTMLNMTMNNMIRAEGNAKYSMYAISLGAVINIILDPIFIFTLNMGIKGAAWATVIAQIISFIFLIKYYLLGKSYIVLSRKNYRFSKFIYSEIMKAGMPSLARQALSSISLALINVAANPYGDSAVAAMGVSLRILSIGYFVVFGFTQGFQPIAGYNYGAKKFKRLFEAIKLSVIWSSIFTLGLSILLMIFAESTVSMFSKDLEVIKVGARTLRATCLLFPVCGFMNVFVSLFQALGKGGEAFILATSRQGIFFIPTIIILPKIFNLDGVIFSQPIADIFTLIVTIILGARLLKKLKEEEKHLSFKENDITKSVFE
ncbi:MATE family efflux transporter [Clostridium ganghwense]|uniref:Multidrug export protein MepA n=1 Tax=Clostridium ganghwense TaxID=312089 RepID=A0ABT4CRE5_9CLOT|nr:MATE family efflux transporter [Clostridium ganghwense]MCY6371640.1 MATE family efflux transporter [Clostridium ganghwense]